MDRYIVREPRHSTDHYEGNGPRMIAMTSRGLHILEPNEPYYQKMDKNEEEYVPLGAYVAPMNVFSNQLHPGHVQQTNTRNISGIDPNYLAAYGQNFNNMQTGIPGHMAMQRDIPEFQMNTPFGMEYQNKNLHGVERTLKKSFIPQSPGIGQSPKASTSFAQENHNSKSFGQENHNSKSFGQENYNSKSFVQENYNSKNFGQENHNSKSFGQENYNSKSFGQENYNSKNFGQENYNSKKQPMVPKPPEYNIQATAPHKNESAFHKVETTTQIMSRSEKLKLLHKTGPRAFTGPVEKVLKWHKSLQDLGALVIYEVIGKCVSIRPGESCAKNLVVRDDNGPAMQVVYYEIDFLLPELKPPCMLRVIGRMLAGTCRLHAFSIRAATGDDIAILPRRAAVAAHHISKLCKEYCTN